jgi:hypothetical protein
LFRQPRVVLPCAAALVAVTVFLAVGGWASVWALVAFAVVAGYVWLRRGPRRLPTSRRRRPSCRSRPRPTPGAPRV